MLRQKRFGGLTTFVAQQGQERPFGVQFRRVSKVQHNVARDTMDAHRCPACPLFVGGLRKPTQ